MLRQYKDMPCLQNMLVHCQELKVKIERGHKEVTIFKKKLPNKVANTSQVKKRKVPAYDSRAEKLSTA